jgi:hypothetical protein
MAPLQRSSTGSITPIIGWPHYGDYRVARLRRSWNGTIAAIINNRLCGEFLSASPLIGTFSSESEQVDWVTRFVASGKKPDVDDLIANL